VAHVALYLEDALTRAGLAVDGFLDATLVPDLPAEVGELFLGVLRSGQVLVAPAAFDLLGGWDALEAGWVSAWNISRIGVGVDDGTQMRLASRSPVHYTCGPAGGGWAWWRVVACND
jgi:hypothetical protein